MKRNLFLYILLLVFLAMCRKTPVVIPENNITEKKIEEKVYIDISDDILAFEVKKDKAHLNIKDSPDNKLIAYSNLAGISRDLHVGKIYMYEKYIVLYELLFYETDGLWHDDKFCVYEYNKDLKIIEYDDFGNKLYEVGKGPYYFEGISNDFLFIDEGTGPEIRGITIFDLVNKVNILEASYYKSYSLKNNIVSGLVISERAIEHGFYDNIKTKFYEYKENIKIPEDNDGLSTEFVVNCNFNILTKEIYIVSGEYIFVQ